MGDLRPLPQRAGAMPMRELIDHYMARYAGRDTARVQRLGWWSARLGDKALQDVSDDHVHVALAELATNRSRYFAGKDVDGRPIYKDKREPLAPATINRYAYGTLRPP